MNYRIEEKEAMILTGFKRRFVGVPNERGEQEKAMYLETRPMQALLRECSEDSVKDLNIIRNVGDDGYDFYIARELPEVVRNDFGKKTALGAEFENVTIPKCTYAVFQTEKCTHPTEVFLDLRRKIASEWLPHSGYQLSDAPELVVTYWCMDDKRAERYRELWIPVVKV